MGHGGLCLTDNVQMMEPAFLLQMYAQTHHLKGVGLASDSGSPSMSVSVMTSISERNEGVPLNDDCPDYDAVVNKRQDSFPKFPWQFINFCVLTPFKAA